MYELFWFEELSGAGLAAVAQVGRYEVRIQVGQGRYLPAGGVIAHEDVTHWDVELSDTRIGKIVSPCNAPAVFARTPWTRYWRAAARGSGVPAAVLEQLVGHLAYLEYAEPPKRERSPELEALIERQEKEQEALEVEWE